MPRTIQVDIAALRRLGADVAGLADQLDTDNRDGTCIGDLVSDPKIRTALKDVQHDWSHKRGAIASYLRTTGQTVQQAAQAYQQIEHQIAQAER
jgi:hypothetical protein